MLPSSIAPLVAAQPTPPRVVHSRSLLRVVLKQRSARTLLAVGLAFLLFGSLIAAFSLGATAEADALIGYAVAAVGVLVTIAPLLFWRRLLFAVRSAPLGHAIVQKLQFEASTRETIDAVTNGMARGTWLVRAGDREFSETFEEDSPWAGKLKPGSVVVVLVNPTKPRVMFAMGIADAA